MKGLGLGLRVRVRVWVRARGMEQARLRCVEFYSGIGGLHYAFTLSGQAGEVVAAYDINDLANSIYEHNFHTKVRTVGEKDVHSSLSDMAPDNMLLQRTLETVTISELDSHEAEAWLLSPPCQVG